MTLLAPWTSVAKDAGTRERLALDLERVLALLAIAAGRSPGPQAGARALAGIAAAAAYWMQGDRALANVRLAFAGLPRLAAPSDAE